MAGHLIQQAPLIWPPLGLSKQETEAIKFISAAVSSLAFFPDGLVAAIELFRFALSKPTIVRGTLASDWRWIATHAAVMQIWWVREHLDVLPKKFRACPTLAKHVDSAALQRALDLYDKHFPDFELFRDAVVHAPRFALNRNVHAPKDGKPFPMPHLDGNRFEVVNKGARYHLDLTDETVQNLVEVIRAVWVAFRPVARTFETLGHAPD